MAKFGLDAGKQVAEQEVKSERKKFDRVELKSTSGPASVRFIMADGPRAVLTYKRHWTTFNSGWSRQYSCPDFGEDEKTCIICAGAPGKDYKEDSLRVVHVFQVIDRKDGKVKLLELPSAAYQLVLAQYEKNGNCLDDRDYVVQLKVTEEGKRKNYRYVVEAEDESAPTKADKALIAERFDLAEAEPQYDEKDIRAMLVKEASDGGNQSKRSVAKSILDDEDDDVQEVVAKVKKRAALVDSDDDEESDTVPKSTKQAAADDDDDEDESARISNLFAVLKKKSG